MFTELANAFEAIAEAMKYAARDCSASTAPAEAERHGLLWHPATISTCYEKLFQVAR